MMNRYESADAITHCFKRSEGDFFDGTVVRVGFARRTLQFA